MTKNITMAVSVNRSDIHDYDALDGQPVRIVCMVAARWNQHAQYLRTLAAISSVLRDEAARNAVLAAPDAAAAYAILTEQVR